jgi:hypothetical protein
MASTDLRIGINVYMPPVRRHWSKILNRPIMSPLALVDGHDDLGAAYIDELHGKDCKISFDSYFGPMERMHVSWYPTMYRGTVWRTRVLVESTEDAEFMKRWEIIYNKPWPFTSVGVHPALADAYKEWTEFHEQWVRHSWDCEAWPIDIKGLLGL